MVFRTAGVISHAGFIVAAAVIYDWSTTQDWATPIARSITTPFANCGTSVAIQDFDGTCVEDKVNDIAHIPMAKGVYAMVVTRIAAWLVM